MSRTTVRTIYAPEGKRRVEVFRRKDGSFGFEEQHYSSEPFEECWVCGPRHSECHCPTEEIVLRECAGRVPWLAESIALCRGIHGMPRPHVTAQPPREINGMTVILFSPIDERHQHTGNCSQIVGGQLQAPAAGIVICRCDEEKAFYLFGCNSEWVPITDTWHESLDDAQRQAEFEYAGALLTWQSLPPND